MLKKLLAAVEWCGAPASASNCIIFMDDGFAEQLKWSAEEIPSNPVFPLHFDSDVLSVLCTLRPQYIVLLVSAHEPNLVHNMKVLAAHSDCAQIVVATLARPLSEEEQRAYAEHVATELQPVTVDIYHVQASAIKLLDGDQANVGLFLLSAPACRATAPLSLNRMGLLGADANIKSVNDVLAEDIPPHLRHELKSLALEVVSALVDTLGMDPTGHVFSVGKTASILGHSLHPLIADALRAREEKTVASEDTVTPLAEAALVLIDRTADLCTPTSTSPATGGSVFARVMATISRQKGEMHLPRYVDKPVKASSARSSSFTMLDVDLQCATLYPKIDPNGGADDDSTLYTMSGLSSLPIQVVPSVCTPPLVPLSSKKARLNTDSSISAEMHAIWQSFASQPEDHTRAMLCTALTRFIEAENGVLPPSKKRGFGAELLALVNSLICSPGAAEDTAQRSDDKSMKSQKYNSKICLKYISVLSFTASIIDSLQRSSTKQFKAAFPDLGSWRASFEDRSAYENRWVNECMRRIQAGCPVGGDPASVSFTHAMKQEQTVDEVILQELKLRVTDQMKNFKGKGKSVEAVDLSNFLTFILSICCLWGRLPSASCIERVKAELSEYLLVMSPSPELNQIDWLSEEIIKDIISSRSHDVSVEDTDALRQQLTLELADIIGSLFTRIGEFVGISPKLPIELMAQDEEHARRRSGLLHQVASLLLHTSDAEKSTRADALKSLGMTHVKDPLKMLARAGLDLLSYGLNSFGLSSAPVAVKEPEPCDRGVVVLFIIGGLSAVEVAQVQSLISLHNSSLSSGSCSGNTAPRVILGSNDIVSPDDICRLVYSS